MKKFLNIYIFFLKFRVTFHVQVKSDATNAAYTSASLGLHSDVPFYDYIPGVRFTILLYDITPLFCVLFLCFDNADMRLRRYDALRYTTNICVRLF